MPVSKVVDDGKSNDKGKVNEVIASEMMNRKEVRGEYERRVCERLIRADS